MELSNKSATALLKDAASRMALADALGKDGGKALLKSIDAQTKALGDKKMLDQADKILAEAETKATDIVARAQMAFVNESNALRAEMAKREADVARSMDDVQKSIAAEEDLERANAGKAQDLAAREKSLDEREEALDAVTAENATRSSQLDDLERSLNNREAALKEKEARLRAALA